MVGKFIVYPVGKTKTASKKGKFQYTFLTGLKDKTDAKALIDRCEPVSFWTEDNYSFEFMKPVEAILDANGDFTQVLEICGGDK